MTNEHQDNYCHLILKELLQEATMAIQEHFKPKAHKPVMVPIIRLNRTIKELGRYYPDRLLIELNQDFVLNHPWYAVVDVLRHELAHHLKHVFHPKEDETPHGPLFRKYCNMLGANPHASGYYPPLDETLSWETTDANTLSPVEQRIQKLLALSSSPNDHEAQQALLKARELMIKHNIDEANLQEDANDPFISMYVEPVFYGFRNGHEYITHEEAALNHILLEYYDVKILMMGLCPPFAASPQEEYREMISLNGRRSKVKIAEYVRHYIANYIFQNIGCEYNSNSRHCRDWTLGVLEGFAEVLSHQNETPEMNALVETNNAELEEFYHARYPRIQKVQSNTIKVLVRQHEAGLKCGRNLHINPGMEGEGNKGLYLT